MEFFMRLSIEPILAHIRACPIDISSEVDGTAK
jgi:hypothetical protein